jgi:hypothetical protein
MFCPNCGHDNLDTAAHCAACGTSLSASMPPPPAPGYGPPTQYGAPGGHTEPKPDNYLIWAILATLCCCLPGGIVAIVYAAQVDSKYNAGDYAGARQSSDNAKLWAMISAGVGLVVGVLYTALNFAAIMGSQGSF